MLSVRFKNIFLRNLHVCFLLIDHFQEIEGLLSVLFASVDRADK